MSLAQANQHEAALITQLPLYATHGVSTPESLTACRYTAFGSLIVWYIRIPEQPLKRLGRGSRIAQSRVGACMIELRQISDFTLLLCNSWPNPVLHLLCDWNQFSHSSTPQQRLSPSSSVHLLYTSLVTLLPCFQKYLVHHGSL